jgi:Ca-activated chloride channel family protein
LLVGREPVPLEGVSVEACIKSFCARVVITQRYRNTELKPIEAVYVFPLEEGAAVCGFEALIGDVHVVGKVEDREEAFRTYDDAMEAGHGAYLLDQERPDVFTASIGNIPPGQEVSVRITYVSELEAEGEDLRFTLPTTVSPRYAPAEDRVGVGRPPAEALNPPVEWQVPYGLDVSVNLEMPGAIRGVESPSHALSTELDGSRGTVRLGTRESALDRDFVLLVRFDRIREPRGWIELDAAGKPCALLSFQPEFDVSEVASEIIFVVDCSGSMGGKSISEARNALQFCLRSLREGNSFNIVTFGSTFRMLFPESRPYDEGTLAQASRHVREMQADLGGTEILKPLQAVLEREPPAGLSRQLFVLTDGQVTNTDDVIQLIRRHSAQTRVFTFGIGAGSSHYLVRGMARAGGGTAEFIYPGERIESKVLRQLGKAMSPALSNVKVDWGLLDAKQAPHYVPPVFAGGRVLIYGFLGDDRADEVTLSAVGPGGPLSFSVHVDPGIGARGDLIATLAARAMIRDLEERSSGFHDRRGSLQERNRVGKEIVQIGVAYGLCSRGTSFVAVEKRAKPVEGELQLRRVPVMLTQGWGGMYEGMPLITGRNIGFADSYGARVSALGMASYMDSGKDLFKRAAPNKVEEAREPIVTRLVRLQRADGSWELTKELAEILHRRLKQLEAGVPEVTGDREEARRAWATALALAWIESEFSAWNVECALLKKKAGKWLQSCTAQLVTGEDWTDAASRFLSSR